LGVYENHDDPLVHYTLLHLVPFGLQAKLENSIVMGSKIGLLRNRTIGTYKNQYG